MKDLTFLFQIVPVFTKDEVPENRKFGGYWFPPENKEDFIQDHSNQTGWCQWIAGRPNPNILKAHHANPAPSADEEVCSVFFDSECGHFLIAPTDCSQTGATDRVWDLGWKRLGFDHLEQGGLSKLTFVAEHHTLGGIGAKEWMPQLLPETYDNHETPVRTELIGDLVLLVAMAAFTCEPRRDEFLTTMRYHFCPPNWQPSPRGKPSISKSTLHRILRPNPQPRTPPTLPPERAHRQNPAGAQLARAKSPPQGLRERRVRLHFFADRLSRLYLHDDSLGQAEWSSAAVADICAFHRAIEILASHLPVFGRTIRV